MATRGRDLQCAATLILAINIGHIRIGIILDEPAVKVDRHHLIKFGTTHQVLRDAKQVIGQQDSGMLQKRNFMFTA
jgi:hypothetical protein